MACRACCSSPGTRSGSRLRSPGLARAAEQLADAAALVRRGDGHLRQLAAAPVAADHCDGADHRVALEREEDHPARRDDRGLRVVQHLEVRRFDLEQPLDPVEVEPAEVRGEFAPERDDDDAAHARPPRHSRASRPSSAESWISPPTFHRSRSRPSRWNPIRSRMRSEPAFFGSTSASSRLSLRTPERVVDQRRQRLSHVALAPMRAAQAIADLRPHVGRVDAEKRAGPQQLAVVLALDTPLEAGLVRKLPVDSAEQVLRFGTLLHRRAGPVTHHLLVGEDREQRIHVVRLQPAQPHARRIERRQGIAADHARNTSSYTARSAAE